MQAVRDEIAARKESRSDDSRRDEANNPANWNEQQLLTEYTNLQREIKQTILTRNETNDNSPEAAKHIAQLFGEIYILQQRLTAKKIPFQTMEELNM